MTIEELLSYPVQEWHSTVKKYVESSDRVYGIKLYNELVEWSMNDPVLFTTDSEMSNVLCDIFDAMCGHCSYLCYIGTGDYDIVEY